MGTNYVTGDMINTTTVAWTTPRGAKCALTLLRNAKLGANGYLQSPSHDLRLAVNGGAESFCGDADDPELGYVVLARMGKAASQVATDKVNAVKALVAEYRDHNKTVLDNSLAASEQYQREHDAIERMRTTGHP